MDEIGGEKKPSNQKKCKNLLLYDKNTKLIYYQLNIE